MTTGDVILAVLVVVLGAAGTFLMLPHRHGAARPRRLHAAGALTASVGLLLFLFFWKPPAALVPGFFFYVFGAGTIIGGVLTITSRNPVYSALWFALVVIATSGLFLLAGASFLAAGTIIVYAGAIIVTFLFVIMLAQMEGKATYDRAARAPGPAAFACFLLLWCLIYALSALTSVRVNNSRKPDDQLTATSRLARAREFESEFGIQKAGSIAGVVEPRVAFDGFDPEFKEPRKAQRRRARRVALHDPSGDRWIGGSVVVRCPDRCGRDHEPQAAELAGNALTSERVPPNASSSLRSIPLTVLF